ncbi:MAG TPA: glycosyltransferase [Thermoanaerobaculia bacterium]|nr:glycosyltransferase [Thermoanaerobaculia bacterium]
MPAAAPRVALVHDWLTGMRGGEKVLEAIAALYPGAPIHTLFHFPGSVSPALEAHPVVTSFLQRAPGVRRHYRRYLPLFPAAIEDFDLTAYDLVISTSHCVAKGAIPAPAAAHLCYVHTPMRYAWDQEHAYFPGRRGAGARLRGMVLSRLRTWDAATAPRVDRFVANSRFVAERIRRYYGRDAAVLAPPVDTEFFPPGDPGGGGPDRPYALAVSAPAPYKRIDLAVRACREVGIDLVVVGDGPGLRALKRLEGPGLVLRGRVEGAELRELYRGAAFLIQPGVEDFGIAPVEALACGTPVVALGRGGVLDIVEDGVHGVLAEPAPDDEERVRRLAAAIDKARGMGFNTLELRQRAEVFSIDRFQRGFRRLVDDLLAGLPRPVRGVAI